MADSARVEERASWRGWLTAALLVTPLLRYLVLVHAVPSGQPWRTTCPHCDTPLAPWSPATLPPARCTGCGRRIGPAPFLVEVTAAAAAAAVVVAAAGGAWSVGGGWSAGGAVASGVAIAGWAAVAVALVFVDMAVHRLPDRLTLPVTGWVLAWLGLAAVLEGTGGAWLRAAAAAAACGGGFGVIALLLGSRGYGLGDAKLALGAGALLGWYGWTAVVSGLLLAFLGSGVVAAVLLVSRRVRWRDSMPFGPYLIGGTLLTLAWVGLS